MVTPIPSELLEPHLSKFLGLMVSFIGSESRPPARDQWEKWHNMLKGVHYLAIGNRSSNSACGVNASLAFTNALKEIDPCWATTSGTFDEKSALRIWKACRIVYETKV